MAPQVALPTYTANMLNSLKAKSLEEDAQLAIMGHPSAFPSVPKVSASKWTIICRVCKYRLSATPLHTAALQEFRKQQCVNSLRE